MLFTQRRALLARRTSLTTVVSAICLSSLLLVTQTACTFTIGAVTIGAISTNITGTVYGYSATLQEQGISKAIPLAGATVRCGSISSKTNAQGQYSLTVKQASAYDCIATSPLYQPQDDSLDLIHGHHLILNFGPSTQSICSATPGSRVEEGCQLLSLDSGSLTGSVVSSSGGKPVSNAIVKCVMIDPSALSSPLDSSDGITATTGANGTFDLSTLPVGPYTCLSFSNGQTKGRQTVTIAPVATTSTKITSCSHNCHPVTFHGGNVMRTLIAYLIFWLPHGQTFDPGGSDSYYESRIKSFFSDLQGSRYFELLTQYWDYQGPVQDQVTLGGFYVDRTPYEHCVDSGLDCTPAAGTRKDPLMDGDIEGEIDRALKANPSWSIAQTHEFFVYTGFGVEECDGDKPGVNCTYSPNGTGYCAYHSFFNDASSEGSPYIYAYVAAPSEEAPPYGCTAQDFGFYGAMPGGDANADMAINFTSHEMFESITDPLYNPYGPPTSGWFDDAVDAHHPGEGEIGDLCFTDFGQIGGDGGNVTLQHGGRFLVQTEWSNLTNSCSLG
jgi:hypothetical protein